MELRSKKNKPSRLNDLPAEIVVAIEQAPKTPASEKPAPEETVAPDSVDGLVERLTAIRERIWRLQAVFATTLSQECALEANSYLQLFQDLAGQLKAKDPSALDTLVRGHESLLQSPSIPVKPTISLELQRWMELRGELQNSGRVDAKTERAPPGYVPDGLQSFL